MNVIFIGIVAVCALVGYLRGFVRSVLPVLSLVCSFAIFYMLREWVAGFLFKWAFFEGGPILTRVAVILILFGIISLLFRVLFGTAKFLSDLPVIKKVDRLLGMLLGGAAGLMIAWLLSLYKIF